MAERSPIGRRSARSAPAQPHLWVASEARQHAPAGPIAGTVTTPLGLIHAVDGDSDLTLCGAWLGDLHQFPTTNWVTLGARTKCPECGIALDQDVLLTAGMAG